jgi:hypothetical protein
MMDRNLRAEAAAEYRAERARQDGADLSAITQQHRGRHQDAKGPAQGPTIIIPGQGAPTLRTARDLQGLRFPPIKWIIRWLLPEGLTILMGAPKLGKSWMTLDIALGVARGGTVLGQDCEQGDVLLLALEDNERRLQDRLTKIAGEGDWPEALTYATDWQRLDAGGLKAMEAWIDRAPNPRLIVVDTLAMVKPPSGRGNAYEADVQALRPMHRLASERRVSIMIVTHKRKMEADDPLEGISGTNGLTGTADTTIALIRGKSGDDCILYGRGRDLAELERSVSLVDCRWQINGDPLEANRGDSWRAIRKAVKEGAATPKDIASVTGMSDTNARQTLGRMVKEGELIKRGRGQYFLPVTPVTTVTKAAESDPCDPCDNESGGEISTRAEFPARGLA